MSSSRVKGFTWTVEDYNLVTRTELWGDALVEAGRRDARVCAVTADLGSSTKIGRFRDAFPERYFNVGIAEQNLMAVASGLAASGMTPVVSTYAAFAALRAAEFVRTDIGYNRRNVKIVGTLSGVSFGQGGPTHHSIEDLALMRAIPGMVVMAPCDGFEAARAMDAALAHDGPVYLRTGRAVEHPVFERLEDAKVEIGRAVEMRPGSDACVIACGIAVWHALAAADRAKKSGVNVRVIAMHTIKPLDVDAVIRAARETRRIVTVEDHSVIGGLGSAVSEVIAERGIACRVSRLGVQDQFPAMGIPEDLVQRLGFDEDGILAALAKLRELPPDGDEDWEDRF